MARSALNADGVCATPRSVRNRRVVLAAARSTATAGCLVAVAGCSWRSEGGDSAPVASKAVRGPVRVDFPASAHGERLAANLRRLQESRPELQIEIELITGDRLERLTAMLAAGSGAPDMANLVPEQVLALAGRKQIVALDKYVTRDRFDLDDFHAPSVEQYRWKGPLYAMPLPGVRVLVINTDVFQRAGVPLPAVTWNDPSWTYDALLDSARRLSQLDAIPPRFGFDLAPDYRGWAPIVSAHGGEVFSKDLRRVTIGEPPAIAALQFLQDVRHKYRVAPTAESYRDTGANDVTLFKRGQTAMFFRWPSTEEFKTQITDFIHDVRPLPRGPGGAFTGGGGTGNVMFSVGKTIEATWECLKYLNSKEVMEEQIRREEVLPQRKSLATSAAWASVSPPPANKKVITDGYNHVKVDPPLLNLDEVKRAMQAEVNKLLNNQQSPSATAAAIKQQVEPLLAEHARLAGA